MCQKSTAIALAFAALVIAPLIARAEMGPCIPDDRGSLTCGTGVGAARVIPKTTSPSNRLALAWRLTSSAPGYQLHEDNPDLESLIVRIGDGAILAKSRGTYWDMGDRYAKAQYLTAAWSPDSRLLIRMAGKGDAPHSAELFAFAQDDSVPGPFDLVKVFDPAVRAEMKGVKDVDGYTFRISHMPSMTIDDQGLIHASVFMEALDSGNERIYKVTAQVARAANSFDAKVLSISQYLGPYISVTIY
jgi:hypothetical protein